MEKREIVNAVFQQVGEIAKTADFVEAGLSSFDVASLCKKGQLLRIRNGFYQLPGSEKPKEEYLLSRFLPQGIVCLESALFYYGYSDFAPRAWTVAVPRSFSRSIKAMGSFPIKAYYVQNEFYRYGVASSEFNGVPLSVYDRERTICDCFKYRTKLDSEIFNKAINAYVADANKNLANLSKYAKDMKIYKKMMPVMEVLLNGRIS
ncbi:MAG: type IV toxin-antitoxin system AbiEi family antitoxin domain-containing protein [Eubacteriales bacterium]|nr:type IV toxin-antitoxin system AbiEi family antitoxin domain-containing protein [Eubacteriales bacterium]